MGFFDSIRRLFGADRGPTPGGRAPRGGALGEEPPPLPRQRGGSRGSLATVFPDAERKTPVFRRETGVTGLDAQQFAPLSTSEAHGTIASMGGIKSAYLDSLSEIPDASLPRIQVIDRTMVGAGLITAEELSDIHGVGREYEARIGSERALRKSAQRAVIVDREEKAALKAAKKAEAEKRRQRHAEDVARRKATDIVFLGRGVSGWLSDRRAHVERLAAKGLAPLATPAELAAAMGLSVRRLRFLSFHSEAPTRIHYVRFSVPKKSGGTRVISSPHADLKAAQRWILDEILSRLDVHPGAHGFLPGRSILTNAERHVGADVLINVDLADFFGSVTFPRIRGLFRGLGYSPAVATILALLCSEAPRTPVRFAGETRYAATGPRVLPQGAPTSPAITNLLSRRMDFRLDGIAAKLGWTYTRYADDLSFSSQGAPAGEASGQVGYLLARIRHIAQDEGFRLNPKKTRVQRPNARQSVTGLVVNHKVGVPRPTVRRLRAILHQAKTEGLEAQNREGHPNFAAWVQGMIAYVEMVAPEKGGRLRRDYEAL